jgi:hypothetical protein
LTHSAPLLLIFDSDIDSVERELRLLLNECSYFNVDSCSLAGRSGVSVVFEGISLLLTVSAYCDEGLNCRKIFTNFGLSRAKSIIALSLSQHVSGGQRVPPVARALLAAGAQIAQSLRAKAIFWSPADLLSDVDYFAEVVESYVNGGAFPVLPTVDFSFDEQRHLLATSGLRWFCGQELYIVGDRKRVDQLELMKRAVRLVHDIAVNGPILAEQMIGDIDKHNWITLSPNETADVVTAQIAAILDDVSLITN